MQSTIAFSGVAAKAPVAAPARRVAAQAFDKKSLAAGMIALTVAAPSFAVSSVDIFDDRKAVEKGFEIIYEARDTDLPQNIRDGFTQARSDLALTKDRVKESARRIKEKLPGDIEKAYWTEAREELRRQVGTLRFDLNTLAETKPKAEKKAALALRKDFLVAIEATDFAIREKDGALAQKNFAKAIAALDAVTAAVL